MKLLIKTSKFLKLKLKAPISDKSPQILDKINIIEAQVLIGQSQQEINYT